MMILEELIPRYDAREVHSVWLDAPAGAVIEVCRTVRGREVRLLGPLMALRGLPSRLLHRDGVGAGDGPVLDAFLDAGFVLLGERPGREFALGAVGRFWSPTGNQPLKSVRSAADFAVFGEPGYAKAAIAFQATREGSGTRLVTETRVVCTDPAARRNFKLYWFLIRPGSGAIRRSLLAAVHRRVAATP